MITLHIHTPTSTMEDLREQGNGIEQNDHHLEKVFIKRKELNMDT